MSGELFLCLSTPRFVTTLFQVSDTCFKNGNVCVHETNQFHRQSRKEDEESTVIEVKEVEYTACYYFEARSLSLHGSSCRWLCR